MASVTDPQIVEAAITTAKRWATSTDRGKDSLATTLLGQILHADGGLEFTLDFVDRVIRPEDDKVAAKQLAELGTRDISFLPTWFAASFQAAAKSAPLAPKVVMPAVRRTFTSVVGDLVVDVSGNSLKRVLARTRKDGTRVNINLLGEAVLGESHARRRLDQTRSLLARDDVDYVSLKVSAVVGPHAPFAFEATVADAIDRLRPLYLYAASSGKFINLDMEEYKDLHLTREVFTRLLDDPALTRLTAGIVVQTYLPDALGELEKLQEWASARVAAGGAPIKVRLVKGANLAMEKVTAELHGWPCPVVESKEAADANFLRALDYCLQPERIDNMRIGVASHNLFSLAAAWELAQLRVVTHGIDIEMLSGMASAQAEAIKRDVGSLLLYLPVVERSEYDAAIAYLVRRLEENAADENFMSRVSSINEPASFAVEEERFRGAIARLERDGLGALRPTRTQDRTQRPKPHQGGFANTPDTDPSLPANQRWAADIIEALPDAEIGAKTVKDAELTEAKELNEVIKSAHVAGKKWAEKPAAERAEILNRVAEEIEKDRARLLRVAADEVGKTLDQADVEVSEACDFARYYAELARGLEAIEGAEFTPVQLTAVVPPWNFPLAIPLGGIMAALAAGSAVVFKPASASRRCGAVLAEACWRAGIDKDVLQFVALDDRKLGQDLITDKRVQRVVLTGSAETAQLFLGWRPELELMAETSGKNAIIVTESADLDLAVADVVASAFGHAGQKCSASSLVILVGSVGRSQRFKNQLLDAVSSLKVAWPKDPETQMGPLTEVPGNKLRRGLTTLGAGETWLLQPMALDDSERLFTPGVRDGVRPGSDYHLTEFFGPILGIMRAKDLDEAIKWQNATAYGLTAGIHSLDVEEINHWCDNVAAGNAYVNRTITGAIVRRQPFGGWKRSVVGSGTKAGGPNYLFGFGDWKAKELTGKSPGISTPALQDLLALARDAVAFAKKTADFDQQDLEWLTKAVASDEHAMATEFAALHDPSDLDSEINVLRYRPAAITVRLEQQPVKVLLRELSAMLASRVPFVDLRLSVDGGYEPVLAWAKDHGIKVVEQSVVQFDTWLTTQDWHHEGRIRFISDRELVVGSIDVAVYDWPSLPGGRIALLPYFKEQSVTITNHRFGNPSRMEISLQ